MSTHNRLPSYRAYLLRCWQEKRGERNQQTVWRFSLEDAHTGERHGFVSLEEMTAFLRRQLEESRGPLPPSG